MEDGTQEKSAASSAESKANTQSRSVGPNNNNSDDSAKSGPMKPSKYITLAVWLVLVCIASVFFIMRLWPYSPKFLELQRTVDTLSYRMDSISIITKNTLKGTNTSATQIKMIKKISTSRSDSVLKVIGQIADAKLKIPDKETNDGIYVYILIAILAGVLGGTLHSLSSLMDFRGQERLFNSWGLWYFCLPIEGGVVSLVFFFIVEAGLFKVTNLSTVSPFGIAAFGMLCGLFTDRVTTKFGEILDAILPEKNVRSGQLVAPNANPPGSSGATAQQNQSGHTST
jgi:hypothetical protein